MKTIRILLVATLLGVSSISPGENMPAWEATLVEAYSRHVVPKPYEAPPVTEQGWSQYLVAKYGSRLSERQTALALQNLRDAQRTNFGPRFTNFDWPGAEAVSGFTAPFFTLAMGKIAGNNEIHLLMDAEGRKLVLKRGWYTNRGHAPENRVLEEAHKRNLDFFVRPIEARGVPEGGVLREYLAVEDSISTAFDRLAAAHAKGDWRATGAMRQIQSSLFQMADEMAKHGISLQSDFKVSEVLLVRTRDGVRVKLTDFENASAEVPDAETVKLKTNWNRRKLREELWLNATWDSGLGFCHRYLLALHAVWSALR